MMAFQEAIRRSDSENDLFNTAQRFVDYYLKKGAKVPGFGHRYHTEDPRAVKLMNIAQKNDFVGRHTLLALKVQDILLEKKGIKMNIDGANASILSDMGFDWRTGTGIFMIGRLPGLISHVYEEKVLESNFRKFIDIEDVYYDGTTEKVSHNKDLKKSGD
jgi:citrate synthase